MTSSAISLNDLDFLSPSDLQQLYLKLRSEESLQEEVKREKNRFLQYRSDPVRFVREVLGEGLWSKQIEILESVRDNVYTACRSCHGAGKTHTAARAVLWFLMTHPGSVVITTAPSTRQVRDLLWRQIRTGFEKARTPLLGRCMTTQIDVAPDWYATGFATDEPINFQGPHSAEGVLVVVDEASGVPEWVFDTARGFMTQNNARMVLIGNPNFPSGSFYEAFGSSRWKQIHISAFDVPPDILRPDWKEEMLEDFGADNPIYHIRVLGEFPLQSENSLFDMTWVEDAMGRALPEGGPLEIGVDVGRYGTDESCAFVRKGDTVIDYRTWQGKDIMQTSGRVIEMCRKFWPSRVKVDEIGIGSGVLDKLKEEGWPAVGFNSNSAAKHKKDFYNLRSEQYSALSDRFRRGEISIPPDRKLLGQLVGLTYEHTSKGQRKLIGKEDLRKQGKKSPNRADALMICFAEAVGGYPARAATAARTEPESQSVFVPTSRRGPGSRPRILPPRVGPFRARRVLS